MRFIAVFIQHNTLYGIGFETLIETHDFLFWGYEDKDLLPCGIYDLLTDSATRYDHFGKLTEHAGTEEVRRFAVDYIDRSQQPVSVSV